MGWGRVQGLGEGGPKAKWRFLKDALWGGGRYKGSGRGPRALVPEGGGRGTGARDGAKRLRGEDKTASSEAT